MKTLVNVSVPAIMQNFDMLIPESLYVSDVTELIVEAVSEKTNYEYRSSGEELLCLKRENVVLNKTLQVEQCGIINGDILVLI